MTDYITKQEFEDFKKALFKYLQETYEMKPKPAQIPKPLEEKLNKWKKPDHEQIINELPL